MHSSPWLTRWWGARPIARAIMPGRADDAEFVRLLARQMRSSSLTTQRGGTVRLHRAPLGCASSTAPVQAPRWSPTARTIPSFRSSTVATSQTTSRGELVELPSGRLLPYTPTLFDEIAEFLTGERSVADRSGPHYRLFTDIVGSTDTGRFPRGPALAIAPRCPRPSRPGTTSALSWERDQHYRRRLRRLFRRSRSGDPLRPGDHRGHRRARDRTPGGLHTGECEVRGDDLGGLAVHIAARVAAAAGADEVLVSGTVKDLVAGSGTTFEDRGEHELKGVPGTWRLYAAEQ